MLFEILFFCFLLLTTIAIVVALVLLVSGRRRTGRQTIFTVIGLWAAYLAIVGVVAATTPQQVLPMNSDLCFDEMCFAVTDVRVVPRLGPPRHSTRAKGDYYVVVVRVSSRARGRVQNEGGLRAELWDGKNYFDVDPTGKHSYVEATGDATPLTVGLAPGEKATSVQIFDLPTGAKPLGLVLDHGFTPGYFVVGECPLFHKPTIIRLPLLRFNEGTPVGPH